MPLRLRSQLQAQVKDLAINVEEVPQRGKAYRESALRMASCAGYVVSGNAEIALASYSEPRHLLKIALTDEFFAARSALGLGLFK